MFPTHGGLGRLGNSMAWWLGIRPYELFLYVFLPPLLLDAAVRIDWFLFKKVRGRCCRRACLACWFHGSWQHCGGCAGAPAATHDPAPRPWEVPCPTA